MQKINFEQTIKLIHKEINVKLDKTNKELDRFLVSAVPIIPKLGNYFFKKRGKQLRPVICLLSSKMINKNYSQITSDINMSAAIEFIHGATLLHDDVKIFCDKYNKKSLQILKLFKGYQKDLFTNLLIGSINRTY